MRQLKFFTLCIVVMIMTSGLVFGQTKNHVSNSEFTGSAQILSSQQVQRHSVSKIPAGQTYHASNHAIVVHDLSLGLKSSRSTISVLILTPDALATSLVSGLTAYPDLTVSVYTIADLPTITLGDLTPYDVVFCYNDNTWESVSSDRTVIGNLLKDYMDAGGKVVEGLYLKSYDNWGLAGGYVTGNYSAFGATTLDDWNATNLGTVLIPSHPIMTGVSSLSNTFGSQDPTLAVGADRIADWANGFICVAAKPNVVSINMLPWDPNNSIFGFTGDGLVLYHNAIVWLAGEATANDVSPTQLLSPLNSDLLTASDSIRVTVINNDTMPLVKIPISYSIDGGAAVNDTIRDTIAGSSSIDFTFTQPYNFSIPGHVYDIAIYTHFATDTVFINDTLETTVTNLWDVAPVSLDGPSIIGAGSASLQATVENLGTMTATFNVTLDISDGFTSTKAVTNLAPGATTQVTFDPWTAVVGDYGVILTTVLAADSVPANNVLNDSIHVAELTKAYCYVAYDATATLPEGPALTSLELPGVVTSLADQTGTNFIGAGTWGNDKWYGAVYTDNTLVSIDTLTGARTTIGTIGVAVSGMAYNYFNDVLYAVDWDGAATNLYTVNTTSGVGTLVGNCTSQLLINLACSKTGILYAASITDDNLYTVNATTGAVSLVGPLGFDAAYAQDMEFDHNNDKLYMAAYNGTSGAGELREVNVTNGSSILIGEFLAGAEITGFAIPGEPTYNNIDAGVQAITTPASGNALTATETITVIVANYGLTDINSGLSVSYVFDGGAPVTQAISSPLLAGTTTTVAFTTTVDLSVAGSNHTIVAYTTLATDQDHSNDTAAIAVQNTFGVYCVAGGGCDEYISNVDMGAISNSSTCTPGGYHNYTSINTPLEEGQTMTITVTNGNPYSTDECGIWVDWNSNGSFEDAGESYTIAGSPGNGPYSSGILAPAGTTLGDKRMRIRITYAQAPLPCGIDTYGEVEDYTIHLIAASGINDLNQEVAVNLFPNPVKEQLNVVCGATINTLRITNMYGALISSYDVQAKQTTINTSNLSSGMYYISLDTDQGTSVQKFIVE